MFQVEVLGEGPYAEFAVVFKFEDDSGLITVLSTKKAAEALVERLNNSV